jgi:hypothetical protein
LKFLKTRNTDGSKYATRSATRNALLKSLKGEASVAGELPVVNTYSGDLAYLMNVDVTDGFLSIGCHTFNRANSKKILRWLGITPTQFVTARKIGKKVKAERGY